MFYRARDLYLKLSKNVYLDSPDVMRAFFLIEAQMETGVKGLILETRLRFRGSESPNAKAVPAGGAEILRFWSNNFDFKLSLGTETGEVFVSSNSLMALTSLVGGEGELMGSEAGLKRPGKRILETGL